jgi:hypothetical protein
MASLQYIDLVGWTSAKEFWTEVVLPDYEQFTDVGKTRDGVHAALTAWHLHDWVFLEQYPSEAYGDVSGRNCGWYAGGTGPV